MKRFKFLLMMLLLSSIATFAENEIVTGTNKTDNATPTWKFMLSVAKPTDMQLEEITDNVEFAKETTFLYNQLQGLCIKRIPVVPGDPTTRIVIKKGELFNAVKKVSKGLENELKENKISKDEAARQMNNVLNVAISAFYADDSKSFEKALKNNKKDYKQLVYLFSKVELK